jgi:hypothetical protein
MAQALHDGITARPWRLLKNARHLTPLEKPDEIAAEAGKAAEHENPRMSPFELAEPARAPKRSRCSARERARRFPAAPRSC